MTKEEDFSSFLQVLLKKNLELHAVGSITGLDGEDRAEVAREDLAVLVLLDGGDDGGVDLLLEGDTLIRDLLLASGGGGLGGLLAEEAGGGLSLLLLLGAGEGGLGDLGEISTGEVDLGGGGDDVAAVDTAEGDTVVLVGTGDNEGLGVLSVDLLEDDAVAATEASGEHDGDGARGDGLLARRSGLLGGVLGLLGSLGSHFLQACAFLELFL